MNYPNLYNMNNFSNYQPGYNQQQNLIRVTGLEGARAYQMAPNSTSALFDNNEDILYIKCTDGAGFPTIRTFRFEEIVNNQNVSANYVTREELEKYGEQLISEFKQYNKSGNSSKSKSADE